MNSTKIFRVLKLNERFLQLRKVPKLQRTFLSEAYQCQEVWDKRLQTTLLQKIDPINFFLELDQKHQSQNKLSAIDVDIFANRAVDGSQVDELSDVLYKLRMTRETTFTLDSTHHAVVRYFLKVGEAKQLLPILNDRLNYGIFCDYFCYNLLMDHFIKQEDFGSAAQVASFMMLQEEFDHPISNTLALYSCTKYLENPDSWVGVDPETLKEEPEEEVKIRVAYIRNPYFDDHFDLWKPSDLVGKTLYSIGKIINSPLGRSCHLRGLVLYRKYEDAIALLNKWKTKGTKEVVYKEIPLLIKKDVPEIFTEENDGQVKALRKLLTELESSDLYQGNLNEDMVNLIQKTVEEYSQEDIETQTTLYREWDTLRMKVLQKQLIELDREARLAKVKKIKEDLAQREEVLTFFEKEEEIELKIEQKLQKEKEMYGDEKDTTNKIEEEYIPPEIVKKRNNM